MDYAEYYKTFAETTITYDVTDWHQSFFLNTNDYGENSEPGELPWCGEKCFNHKLMVTSEIN